MCGERGTGGTLVLQAVRGEEIASEGKKEGALDLTKSGMWGPG